MADYSLLTAVNLVFDPDGPALICKACQYALAVSGSQVTSHLWNKHQIRPESRRDITPLIRSLKIPNPTDIRLRPDKSLVHPHLEVYRGYACLTCKYRTINLETMTRHVSSCCPPPRAPSTRRRNPDDLYQDVQLQTWASGASRKYWIVRRALTHDPLRIFSGSSHLDAIHQRERAYIAACDREAMQETGVKKLELTSPWMERTKWAHVYEGTRRDLLVKISEVRKSWSYNQDFPIGHHEGVNLVSKRSDEQKIWQLMAALDRALDRCEETMRRTGHPILCWLNSGSRTRFYQKPFGFLGRAATRQRYRRLFQRIIPFIFRAYNMTPAMRKSALGICFTGEQLCELRKVWMDDAWDDIQDDDAENARDEEGFSSDHDSDWEGEDVEEGADEDEDSDDDEDEQDVEEEEVEDGTEDEIADEDDFIGQACEDEDKEGWISDGSEDQCGSNTDTPEVDKLAELAFRLSIFFITEVFTDGQPSSSLLVYYSGVLGCTENGSSFRRPKDYTSHLSALIYVQRLLLLEFALPHTAYEYVGLPRRPQLGQLESLNKIRLECMVFGCLTPLGEFLSLRAFGRKQARSDTPSFLVRWSDDGSTLFYDDTSISMENFRNFGHSLVLHAEALCDKLMFNWLPRVDLNRVRDEMSNTRQGYSFIQDPANDLSTAYLTLSTRACTAQGDGLLQGDRWDFKAVSEYLKMTEAHQGYLAGTMLTLGGQGPRATELLSLEYCNGQSSQRGVYVYNGFMIYVTRHHKAKRSTNNEFTVVRFLPAKVGKLLYYYLVYIRPFAAMLQRETSRCRVSSNFLFCSPQAPQRPWHSKRLADILVKSSTGVFDKPINIRLYRQLSISITEKHVKKLAKPFNRYDDQSASADPNVVFAWQSGHRPRQRGTTYGLDGAFPSQMQPALLNIYEWASVEWHQYLGHQSRSDAPIRVHQQQLIRNFNAAGNSKGSNLEGNASVASHLGWRASNRRPKLAKPSYPSEYSFLPPVTQATFLTSAASTVPVVQEQPLKSIAVNRLQSGSVLRQKRPYEISLEDGGDGPRKKTTGKRQSSSLIPGNIKPASQREAEEGEEEEVEDAAALILRQFEEEDARWEEEQVKIYNEMSTEELEHLAKKRKSDARTFWANARKTRKHPFGSDPIQTIDENGVLRLGAEVIPYT
jgi:hypothetical protein